MRPWLGKEAAFALLNTRSTSAGSLILLDVRSRKRAQAFLDSSGAQPVRVYRGVTELRYRRGTVLAFVDHYLAIGQRASVKSAIDDGRRLDRVAELEPLLPGGRVERARRAGTRRVHPGVGGRPGARPARRARSARSAGCWRRRA